MGSGSWDASTYASTTRAKINTGTTFAYTATARTTGKVHETLDPTKANAAGVNVRESRDSDEHPNSVPIAVFFDETGSMGGVPRTMQTKLAELYGLLLRKGYVDDPQILVGAYGDAWCDTFPLQVSQFESDNRVDDALDLLVLEGGGGGNGGESMGLGWYYLATHTETDAWEKRGKKGYAFFIGDEVSLQLTPEYIKKFVGDGEPLVSLDNKALVSALQEKWDAYVLVINNWTAQSQKSVKFYQDLFGEHCIVLEDENAVAETIGLAIGLVEGTIDLDEGVDHLKELGLSSASIDAASKALATVGGKSGGSVVTGGSFAGLSTDKRSGAAL